MSRNRWLITPLPRPAARLRLFCFHYAGAGPHVYRNWPGRMPESVETCLVHLPGRGARGGEPLFRRMGPLVEAVFEALSPLLGRPYVLFGHSMGAVLAYEFAATLRGRGARGPAKLFVSGRPAPHLPPDRPPIHGLPDSEFIEELRNLNGTPPEVLEHEELMAYMLPIIRADFEVIETHEYRHQAPLACPIVAYGGQGDEHTPPDRLEAWRQQTTGTVTVQTFAGDHFFIHSAEDAVLAAVAQELAPLVNLSAMW